MWLGGTSQASMCQGCKLYVIMYRGEIGTSQTKVVVFCVDAWGPLKRVRKTAKNMSFFGLGEYFWLGGTSRAVICPGWQLFFNM